MLDELVESTVTPSELGKKPFVRGIIALALAPVVNEASILKLDHALVVGMKELHPLRRVAWSELNRRRCHEDLCSESLKLIVQAGSILCLDPFAVQELLPEPPRVGSRKAG